MSELDLNPQPKKDPRMLAIGLAVAAAVLLAFAAFSKDWVARPMSVGFGPMGCHDCNLLEFNKPGSMSNGAFVDMMRTMGEDGARHTSSAFAPAGWITFGLCLIAVLGLLGAAGLAFAKKRPDLPVAPSSAALLSIMVALISGCVFVATKPGGPGFVGVSNGFWAFGIGAVMAIAAAQMLAKINRPVDPDLLDGAMNPEQY
ncbi:MAG: hypothetical protein JWP01_2456 [Myxococcales bacterium]|nr:hypothetical protein [Myxococcales bacterium]